MSNSGETKLYRALFKNETDTQVKVYFYHKWDGFYWVSKTSKFIDPQQSYYKGSNWKIKYRVESDEIVSDIQFSQDASIIHIRGNGNFTTDDFYKPEYDSLRRDTLDLYRFKEEHKWGENDHEHLDLYKVLGLDIKEIRKLDRDEGTAKIKEAFFEKIRNCNSDKRLQRGYGNEIEYDAITKEIIQTYGILRNPIKRAAYNNYILFTGRKGWRNKINPRLWPELLKNFFTSIFWPDVGSKKEKKQRKRKLAKRLVYFAISVGLFTGGVCVTTLTGGLALVPVGLAMISGGIWGAVRAGLKQKCGLKDFLIVTGVGAIVGAATGGASAVMISAGAQIEAFMEFVTSAVGGITYGLGNDIERITCDANDISLKHAVEQAIAEMVRLVNRID